jgi:hypothetical protein
MDIFYRYEINTTSHLQGMTMAMDTSNVRDHRAFGFG